ncbi:NAD(P)-binding protein [Mycena amicta]|nr:NAD(P)-binding protein [Mycena amicta]
MPTLAHALKLNSAFTSRYPTLHPTAVFVGGTSGIGQALAQRLAHHTKGNSRILLVGRNEEAARKTIDSFPSAQPSIKHEFIPCDVSLMANVRHTTASLLARTDLTRLNFLVLSPGFFSILAGRNNTSEGIDKKLAVLYYARWLFTYQLLHACLVPLLRNAAEAGEPAHVYSVLGAGTGGKVDFDDLGLKKRYGALKAAMVSATYTDLAMQKFATTNPSIQFSHAFPGLVRTPMLLPKHWALKPLAPLISAASRPFTVSPETCAEYHLSALVSKTPANASSLSNFTRRGATADDIGYNPASEEHVDALWKHTMAETRAE